MDTWDAIFERAVREWLTPTEQYYTWDGSQWVARER